MDLNTLASGCTVCLSDEEKYQNGTWEYQSDLEVILEFLEEHYRQESGGKSFWSDAKDLCSTSDAVDASETKLPTEEHFGHGTERLSAPAAPRVKADNSYSDSATNNLALDLRHESDGPAVIAPKASERPLTQNTTPETATKPLAGITPAEKGKKLRLFHFLFEVLEDPKMADCVSWVPASVGVFCFSARHKERVAELWGQRKGNRMPMTYQKMSRALRNYVRSGEIIKVKKKLTYQFSVATLITLKSQHGMKNDPFVSK